jgi:8-oxo-dGTP diphosphatase
MSEIGPETAQLTADVVLFAEDDDQLYVLVIRRGWPPFEGCWAVPGGYVDPGEDTMEAAGRELGEETGLTAESLRLVGVYADSGRDPRGRFVSFAYTARLPQLIEPVAGDDAAEARWMPVDEALSVPNRLAFDHYVIVHDALRVIAAS